MEKQKDDVLNLVEDEEIRELATIYKGLDEPGRRMWISGGSLLCASQAARENSLLAAEEKR